MTEPKASDVNAAIAAELSLLRPEVRADAKALDLMLAADFEEIGKTGRLWTRSEIIEALSREPGEGVIETAEMQGASLARGLVLVRYVSITAAGEAHRSSIWRHEDIGWRIVFHQGTKIS